MDKEVVKKKKKVVIHVYIMGNYSAIKRNKFEFVLERWMNLEPAIQGEV